MFKYEVGIYLKGIKIKNVSSIKIKMFGIAHL